MLFAKKEFKGLRLPPIYILKIISLWYNQEEIHWIQNNTQGNNDHYVLSVRHILSWQI